MFLSSGLIISTFNHICHFVVIGNHVGKSRYLEKPGSLIKGADFHPFQKKV